MIKYFLTLLVIQSLVMMTQRSYSQHDPQYSHCHFNQMMFNPAYAGLDDSWSSTLLVRNQWVGLDGLPLTQTISSHAPIDFLHGGIGLSIMNDLAGAERTTSATVSYAFHFELGQGILSFGVGGGILQNAIDGEKLRAPEGNYEGGIDHNDQFIPVKMTSAFAPEASAGIYFKNKKIDLGLGVSHLLESQVQLEAPNNTTTLKYMRHFYFNAGYNIDITDNVSIKPNIMIKSDLVQTQAELNAMVFIKENIWTGLAFRGYSKNSYDALIGFIGMNLTGNIKIGYSYDFNVSALRNYNSGTHEIVLNYRLPFGNSYDPGKIIYNPRSL